MVLFTSFEREQENAQDQLNDNFKEIIQQLEKVENTIPKKLLTGLLNSGKQAWSGAWYGGEGQTITPSVPLSECLTGWMVTYQPYDSKTGKAQPWDMNYVFIPKTHGRDFPGVAVVHHLETLNGAKFNKYIYVTNTTIKGHKNNNTVAKYYVITKLYAM